MRLLIIQLGWQVRSHRMRQFHVIRIGRWINCQRHGENEATLHAAMRADELLEAGDLAGSATWRRVIKAIDIMTAKPPADAQVIRH